MNGILQGVLKRVGMVLTGQAILAFHIHSVRHSHPAEVLDVATLCSHNRSSNVE